MKLTAVRRWFLIGLGLSLVLGVGAIYSESEGYMRLPMLLYLMTTVAASFFAFIGSRTGQGLADFFDGVHRPMGRGRNEDRDSFPRSSRFCLGYALPLGAFIGGKIVLAYIYP